MRHDHGGDVFGNWKANALGVGAALIAGLLVVSLDIARPLDLAIYDRLVGLQRRIAPLPYTGPEVAIVGFDEAFLARIPEPFALVHVHLAQALSAMSAANPKVVAIDLNLPSKSFGFLAYRDQPDINFDIELARALATLNGRAPVVLGVGWNPIKRQHDEVLPSFVAAATWAREPLSGTTQGRDPRSSVTVCRDPDGAVREFPGRHCQAIEGIPAFATRILEALGQRTDEVGLVNFALGPPLKYVPVSALLAAHEAGDTARLSQMVGDKIVIVAAILTYSDRLDLPARLSAWEPNSTYLPGALFHAQAVRTLAAHALLAPMPPAALQLIAVALSLFWFCRGLITKAALAFASVLLAVMIGWGALSYTLFAPVATLALSAIVPLLLRLIWDVRSLSRERTFLGSVFRGSVSPRVLAGILSGRLDPARRGGRVHVHVMFADIRGFTRLSEQTEPERVIRILNAYLGEATRAVHGVNGTIDKFLGDGVLAVFGAPEPLGDSWNAALTAARDLVARIRQLNLEHADYRITPIELGIGIHAGDAIVGFVGSSERYEFTTIGDTVNVASRIQGLSAELGFPILASVDALPQGGRLPAGDGTPLGPQKIKGHTDIDIVGFSE